MNSQSTEEELIAELASLESTQARIDHVTSDLDSGTCRYECVEAWKLGEVLGIEWEDACWDWGTSYACRRTPEEDEAVHPFAENISYLEGLVSKRRFQELKTGAAKASTQKDGPDLKLTEKEVAKLKEAYAKSHADCASMIHFTRDVYASSGGGIEFEGCIGDGGEVYDVFSSYDHAKGKRFDLSEYISID